jgi:hypothetical protein
MGTKNIYKQTAENILTKIEFNPELGEKTIEEIKSEIINATIETLRKLGVKEDDDEMIAWKVNDGIIMSTTRRKKNK